MGMEVAEGNGGWATKHPSIPHHYPGVTWIRSSIETPLTSRHLLCFDLGIEQEELYHIPIAVQWHVEQGLRPVLRHVCSLSCHGIPTFFILN